MADDPQVNMLAHVPEGGRVAVVRFSALGDVVLAGAALRQVARLRPDVQLVLLTKRQYADLYKDQDWLEVWPLDPDTGVLGLWRMARKLRAWQPHLVADLHATLRARVLHLLSGSLNWQRVDKKVWRRRLAVQLKATDLDAGHIVQRYGDVFNVRVQTGPWLDMAPAPTRQRLALIPGAAWPTKKWPADRWPKLAAWWQARGGDVLWVGGPDEVDVLQGYAQAVGGIVEAGAPLSRVAAELAGCCLAISGDTGPGHLAAAVGTPVVTMLGPTIPAFGFVPWGRHQVVEVDLDCRPCTLHGSRHCPEGHHRCMRDISAPMVMAAAERLLDDGIQATQVRA